MKKLKIRFVQFGNTSTDYLIQRRRFFVWWYICYTVDMGYGGFTTRYRASTKEELLKEVLEKKYHTCKDFVKITEYPELKQY